MIFMSTSSLTNMTYRAPIRVTWASITSAGAPGVGRRREARHEDGRSPGAQRGVARLAAVDVEPADLADVHLLRRDGVVDVDLPVVVEEQLRGEDPVRAGHVGVDVLRERPR